MIIAEDQMSGDTTTETFKAKKILEISSVKRKDKEK